jgi:hypothetical protein
MTAQKYDLIIFGAGIAGLWTLNHFRGLGYNAILLETDSIGCGQTIAAQGIIHSGLKYAFAGKVNKLAQSISAMPDRWRSAFKGDGPVDLSAAHMNAQTQYLMIPGGLMGGLMSLVTRKALGGNVRECPRNEWPDAVTQTGFKGQIVFMDEPVIDVPSVIKALAEPHKDYIFQINQNDVTFESSEDSAITSMTIGDVNLQATQFIFTAAGSNHAIATSLKHDGGLKTQKRPLVQGMMKNAPYEMYAHLVGPSDKPIATITTHTAKDGSLVWYLGGNVAERDVSAPPADVYKSIHDGFKKYLPNIDLTQFEWSVLPINRVEGQSSTQNHLPDTPTIHVCANALYCWPTKMTFAPLLADMLAEKLVPASHTETRSLPLPLAEYTETPWDKASWSDKP